MKLFRREQYLSKIRGFYDEPDLIKVIVGVRRSGKSSLMETISEELSEHCVAAENLIFINLDKRGYKEIKTPDQLEKLIEEKTASIHGLKYLFIDEIQNVSGFEEVINGFREDGDCSIFITGSNSYLLSGELVTKLTGRYLEFEVFPLNFMEYEQMKAFYKKNIDSNPLIELNNYILEGGFPRALFFDNLEDKRKYTEEVVREIFEKDIRKRMKIKNIGNFEIFRQFLINNFGAVMSMRSIQRALVKSGKSISEATVSKYLKILEDAKIIYECPRFDMKSKRSLGGEKKYYLSDMSFYYALNTDNNINYGPVLENIFFIYAKSRHYAVSMGRIGNLECDFIVRTAPMSYSYFQISYTIMLNKATEDREYRPLENIRDNYPKYVLTTDYLLQKRNGIIHKNIIDFLKNGEEF